MKERFISISCGSRHSLALSETGKVYMWGVNGYGQLGWTSKKLLGSSYDQDAFCCNAPQLIPGFEDVVFCKALCGPNHTLLLTSDGSLYSFGENTVGQIGNGSVEHQSTPVKIMECIRFQDIITGKENDMSIAVSDDHKLYIWGLVDNRKCCVPKEVTDCLGQSVFDVYARNAKIKILFKTINLNNELNSWELIKTDSIDLRANPSHRVDINDEIYQSSEEGSNFAIDKERYIDDIVDLKLFLQNPSIIDNYLAANIRLFRVFGIGGSKYIFTTIEDEVYCFGYNRDGSLGLGVDEEFVIKPTLNNALTGKQVIDIVSGFEHCIGLTENGQCYGWGLNKYGQVGIGNCEKTTTPTLINSIADLKVVQICCGAYHSMALTDDGDLFAWGYNTFAQLGDRSYNSRRVPTQVLINEKIARVSSGMSHCAAMTDNGCLYVWGCNTKGQLGHSPLKDPKTRTRPMSNRPTLVSVGEPIAKAICGPNHTLVLTTSGSVYAFGENKFGQIGNGTTDDQHIPIKINKSPNSPKIREIITNSDNDLSIAVSVDNKIYCWGLVKNQKFLRPKRIVDKMNGNSLFDIFANLAKHRVTFKTVNIDEDLELYVVRSDITETTSDSIGSVTPQTDQMDKTNELITQLSNNGQEDHDYANFYYGKPEMSNNLMADGMNDPLTDGPTPTLLKDHFFQSLKQKAIEMMGKKVRDSFNDPKESDLMFKSEDKIIYSNKTVLKIRNKKFWQKIGQEIIGPNQDIYIINGYSFEAFNAFLQYLYGIEPEVDIRFVNDLQNMAKLFEEPELEERCLQLIRNSIITCIDVSNVCQLYEKAVKELSIDVMTRCVEFAANNWPNICKSDSFRAMDEKLSKKFVISAFNNK